MEKTDFKDIGARLKAAFRLSTRPLAVYGSEVLPSGIPPMKGVNRCFAISLLRMTTRNRCVGNLCECGHERGLLYGRALSYGVYSGTG